MELIDRITQAIDKGEYTEGIFLDLPKAFDTTDHTILIQKLDHYGIRGITKSWFEVHLKNRKQIVKYNDIRSKEMVIKNEPPQESILRPILFLLYINYIEYCSNLVSFILFADNTTTIFYSNKCLSTLNKIVQIETDEVAEWLNAYKLPLNVKKKCSFCLDLPGKKPPLTLNLRLTIKQ